jgi:N-acetylmuramoyl-L-alanine amidase
MAKSTLRDSLSETFGIFKQIGKILFWGVVAATVFIALTPGDIIENSLAGIWGGDETFVFEPESQGQFPTPTPRPRPVIGIVAGHWGSDAGAVCIDGLTEAEVNLNVASIVQKNLVDAGFDVDLLKEFDPLLEGYRALALVSIHADSCEYINDSATGYKVAAALSTTNAARAERLTACLRDRYESSTLMGYHANSVTADMTSYHAFDEIHHDTVAAIIEIGFMNLDRQLMVQQPETIARGISDGILCYIYNQDITSSGSE